MDIYNEKKTKILEESEIDLEKGHLVEDKIVVHHDAIQGQKLIAYYDQANKGKYTVVQPFIEAKSASNEEVAIYKYVLYTSAELAEIKEEKAKETLRSERTEKEAWLSAHDYIGTKIATGRATIEEYAEDIATMKEYADRINAITLLLGENK